MITAKEITNRLIDAFNSKGMDKATITTIEYYTDRVNHDLSEILDISKIVKELKAIKNAKQIAKILSELHQNPITYLLVTILVQELDNEGKWKGKVADELFSGKYLVVEEHY